MDCKTRWTYYNKTPITISQNVNKHFWNENKDINSSDIIWKEWKNQKIPFLFEKDTSKDIITYKNNQAIINYDIVAATFYFLSGWNELTNSEKDQFGRITFQNSIINKLGISKIPVVNYYFEILKEAIEEVTNSKIKKNLWEGNAFGAALTHDIDTCKSAWLQGSFSELKKKRIFSIPKLVISKILGKDDWFNFEKITQIEREFDATSSFYFLPEKGKVGKWMNADYKIDSKGVQKAITTLKEKGHEIGVHGSFGTYIDKKKLQLEIDKINHWNGIGNRFHFLMFDPLKTVSTLEECNVKYDTSLGFAEQIGFRRATCFPFYLYNFEKNKISPVIEVPLITMDGSLGSSKYMGLSKEESLKSVFEIIDEIKKFEGVFTLLWHNTYFSDYKYTGWREVYIEILRYCKKNNGLLNSIIGILSKIKL